jgi:hypothetical protein
MSGRWSKSTAIVRYRKGSTLNHRREIGFCVSETRWVFTYHCFTAQDTRMSFGITTGRDKAHISKMYLLRSFGRTTISPVLPSSEVISLMFAEIELLQNRGVRRGSWQAGERKEEPVAQQDQIAAPLSGNNFFENFHCTSLQCE